MAASWEDAPEPVRLPVAVGTSITAGAAAAVEDAEPEAEVEADAEVEVEADAEVEVDAEAEVDGVADAEVLAEEEEEPAPAEEDGAASPPPPQAVRARAATDRTAAERPMRRAFTEVPLSIRVTMSAGFRSSGTCTDADAKGPR